MSKDSKRLRAGAAKELRESRKKGVASAAKSKYLKLAASYKALADNEEWLEGEKSRSKPRPRKVR